MHLLTIVGARPQFIKAAVVSHEIKKRGRIHETVLHTGQHFDSNMSAIFFDELDIPEPKVNLNIHGGSHGEMTGRMLEGIERTLLDNRPDAVLVYGDTNSTLAGALAAAKLNIPVAHVEAGVRSFNRRVPEELNRILTDHASDLLFVPTVTAVDYLAREGIAGEAVRLVGDVMYDAVLHFTSVALQRSTIVNTLGLAGQSYVLCTIHRAENTDNLAYLRNILVALETIAKEIRVVLPLHPRTLNALSRFESGRAVGKHITVIDPVGYLDMTRLTSSASLVVTDSGGMQREAFFHRVPCVTLQGETEWMELVDAGWNRLTSVEEPNRILSAINGAIGTVGREISPYGNGDAAARIVEALDAM